MTRILPLLFTGVAILLLGAPPADAQSLLGSGGFGTPVEPLDARARAMGNAGIGLFGSYLLPGDPSGAAGLRIPTISASIQPTRTVTQLGGSESSSSASRFPLLAIGYPVAERTVATLTFGSYLDQRWNAETERTIPLAGEDVEVLDTFISDGGISAIRLGLARQVTNQLAVGVTGGVYTGELRRVFTRRFDQLTADANVAPFETGGRWRMRAPTVGVAAHWDFQEFFRLAASVNWAGTLEMTRTAGGTLDEVHEVDLPTEFRAGASAILTPQLALTASMSYADWTGAGEALGEGSSAGTIWSFGGGTEWDGPTLRGRSMPVRLGYRHSGLPFSFDGNDPTESVYTGGVGITLAQIENVPLARLDIGIERGSRDAGTLSETFWRTTFSLRVSGG